jgi:uroporphyrinogen decarboxylase
MPTSTLSHRERLEVCLSGAAADRIPAALWRHFPVDDQTPEGLAAATTAFQKAYDFDLIKVTPTSSFCIKDWGVEDRWTGNPEGTRDYIRRVIHQPEDWARLEPLNPHAGRLGEQLTCLRLLAKEYSPHTPFIQTIFSPMSQAKNLVGADALLVHMRRDPQALHEGLKTITETTIRFLEEAIKTGIDGVFYAIQHGQYGLLSPGEFDEFCRAYDLQVMEAAKDLWLNMLHLHGEAVMFDQILDYPAAIINWHDRQVEPNLAQALTRFNGVVCGGLRQWETMVLGSPEQVRAEAEDAIRATGGKRFILGTGCVLPTTAPYGNIMEVKKAVERGVISQ